MSKVYLVTYDYVGETSNLVDFFKELKSFESWWHYIDGTWLLAVSDQDANSIYQLLKPHMPKKMNLFVAEIGMDRQGWLPRKAWAWIKRHLPKTATT